MITIQNKKLSLPMLIGILILVGLSYYYPRPNLPVICGILFAIYLIVNEVFYWRKGILEISLGFVYIICILIGSLLNKLPLLSLEGVFFGFIALIFIIEGILLHSGYISHKWFTYE